MNKGTIVRNKARLVAHNFNQAEELDYDEIYASVACLESIWILLAYVVHKMFKLYQMNVKSTFLNSFIKERFYVKQPPKFECLNFLNHVYKLKKALLGEETL